MNSQIPTKNNNNNKNQESGEEIYEGEGLGAQVYLPTCQRSTRSTEKAVANKNRSKSNRDVPYEKPADREPYVCIPRIDMGIYKMEKIGSTFGLSARTDGEPIREMMDPQPGTSGLEDPHPPTEKEETRDIGVSRDPSPAPTMVMTPSGSQEEIAEADVGSPNSSDGEMS